MKIIREHINKVSEDLKALLVKTENKLKELKKNVDERLNVVNYKLEALAKKQVNLETALGLLETRLSGYFDEKLQEIITQFENQFKRYDDALKSMQSKLDMKIKAHESYVNLKLAEKEKEVVNLRAYIEFLEKQFNEYKENYSLEAQKRFKIVEDELASLSTSIISMNESLDDMKSRHNALHHKVNAEHAERLSRIDNFIENHEKRAKINSNIDKIGRAHV